MSHGYGISLESVDTADDRSSCPEPAELSPHPSGQD